MANEQLSTYLPEALKDRWKSLAAQRGMTNAALLRAAVQAVLKTNYEASHATDESQHGPRLHIRLRLAEETALRLAAEKDGMTRQAVVLALIRAHLLRQPTASAAELAALRESNRQLAAVGRNLNQLAHSAHGDGRNPAGTEMTLERLQVSIDQLHSATTHLVHHTLYRWTNRDLEGQDDG